jgi:hypothetical protein
MSESRGFSITIRESVVTVKKLLLENIKVTMKEQNEIGFEGENRHNYPAIGGTNPFFIP